MLSSIATTTTLCVDYGGKKRTVICSFYVLEQVKKKKGKEREAKKVIGWREELYFIFIFNTKSTSASKAYNNAIYLCLLEKEEKNSRFGSAVFLEVKKEKI